MSATYKTEKTFTVFHAMGYCTVRAYTLKGAAMRAFRVLGVIAESVVPGKLTH